MFLKSEIKNNHIDIDGVNKIKLYYYTYNRKDALSIINILKKSISIKFTLNYPYVINIINVNRKYKLYCQFSGLFHTNKRDISFNNGGIYSEPTSGCFDLESFTIYSLININYILHVSKKKFIQLQ